ncbi:hypothetical protein GCK72_021573 [Caenorhabditis remanei]|uniref:SGNH hydrolase-type esterase domain-containing protein n=1 Tax=Caenorhabditis remanei TaxID=31234 RepID=A0A6A5GK73_CAERE|nr:hypothetical protein GCK72_021573 [Caenorhabditis remanei]KAF1755006.1 hypothetical protein GCK72_021573 [Caenorhabditis remanei]
MLAFLYFVQMLINLPKMLVLSWNNMIFPPSDSSQHFRISTVSPSLWMTSSDINVNYRTLNLSICHVSIQVATWRIDDVIVEGTSCSRILKIDKLGGQRVTVDILKAHGEIQRISEVVKADGKFWMVAIGDSFSSGQGNPDKKSENGKKAEWMDEPCYRSTKAFPYLISRHTPNSALSFLSCSGSTVENSIISKNGQLEHLQRLITAHGAPPDLLFLTIGGNDIGFTDVISLIQRDSKITDKFDMRFFFVSHQIDRVAWKLKEMNVSRVVLLDYYDVTKNEKGEVDGSCGAFGRVSLPNLQLADRKILQRLNSLLRRKAAEHRWITVDTTDIFRTRGICSSRSLIRSRNESMMLQGNEYGSFHPNEEAHRLIAERIVKTLEL